MFLVSNDFDGSALDVIEIQCFLYLDDFDRSVDSRHLHLTQGGATFVVMDCGILLLSSLIDNFV